MVDTRRLFSNAALSVLQTLVSGALLFFLYRFLLDQVGAEELGLWALILAGTSMARLSDLGVTGSVVKFVALNRAKNDNERAASTIQTAAVTILTAMTLFGLAIYPLIEAILAWAVPPAGISTALRIVPWAIGSLCLAGIAGVFQSGLDGCHRIDLRNYLLVGGNIAYFVAALILVPRYGLEGLAVGQAGQSLLLVVIGWLLLRGQLPQLPWIPRRWSKQEFREMFSYAVNFQVASIAMLLFDPITKIMMSRYGGLSSTAYYEMASQMVLKCRALLIAGNQSIVPAVAEVHELAPEKVRGIYLHNYRLLFFLAMPFFAAILASLPVISEIWLGRREEAFVVFAALCVVGWGANTMCAPAYFSNIGTGHLAGNTVAHLVIGILNISLGALLGYLFDGIGVAVGVLVALVVGSAILIVSFHLRLEVPISAIVPEEHVPMLWIMVIAVFACLFVDGYLYPVNGVSALSLAMFYLVMMLTIWKHPYRSMLTGRKRILS